MTNYLVQEGVPQALVETMSRMIPNKWVFLLALNVVLLIVGCMMDIFSAIVIVVPLIVPLAAEFGVHPIHLAIIFLVNLELGYNTPPVGMNLFIASFRFRQPILRLYRAAMPFVLLALLGLALITYVEPLSTFTVPEGAATVQGGMIEQPAAKPEMDDAPQAPGKPVLDGLCDGDPADPDCEEIDIDDDL
jgi:TRAP-type C4-dicarboxylate transport system permease large subunit